MPSKVPAPSPERLRQINLDTYYTLQQDLMDTYRGSPYRIHDNSMFAKHTTSERDAAFRTLEFLEGHVHPFLIAAFLPLALTHPDILIGHGHSKDGYFLFGEDKEGNMLARVTFMHELPYLTSDIEGVVFEAEHMPEHMVFTAGKHVVSSLMMLAEQSKGKHCKFLYARKLTSLDSPGGVETYFTFGPDHNPVQVWTRVNTYDCDRRANNLAVRLYGIIQRTWGDTAPLRTLNEWSAAVNVLAAYDLKRLKQANERFATIDDLVYLIREEKRIPNLQPTMTDYTEELTKLSNESKHAVGRVCDYLMNPDGNANGYYVRDISQVEGGSAGKLVLFTLDDLIGKRSFKLLVRDPPASSE